jgi:hypothetical protein
MSGIVEAAELIEKYDALVERAIEVAGLPGNGSFVETDDRPRLSIDVDAQTATLTWRGYESDYYGSGSTTDERTTFSAFPLFMPDDVFEKWRDKTIQEAEERDARVRKAQLAVERDRREAHDRAEWARLRAKYGMGT